VRCSWPEIGFLGAVPLRLSGANLRHAKEGGDEPLAVFEFEDEDESYVDAYASLQAAEGELEGYDVRNGEGDFFAADGRAIEATTGGKWGLDVSLRVTDHHRPDELRARLAAALPAVGIDASLADSPLAAAQALIDARWNARWPRWPVWLDRRLNGSRPTVIQP
jgi:hypothetical protein